MKWKRLFCDWRLSLFILPSLVLVAASACGWWLFPHYPNRPNDDVYFTGLKVASLLCPVLGYWWAWRLDSRVLRIAVGTVSTAAIWYANMLIGHTVSSLILSMFPQP